MHFAVDAGQSGTRATAMTPSGVSIVGSGAGVRHLAAPGAVLEVAEHIRSAINEAMVPRSAGVETISLGLSGFVPDQDLLASLATAVMKSVPATSFVVASDAFTSHLGALECRAGIVAAIGTGAVVVAADGAGRWVRIGGWGYLLDDAGSGFDVGRRGLGVVLHVVDGIPGSAGLERAAEVRFGSVARMMASIYGAEHPASAVAAFAEDVVAVAKTGDTSAKHIIQRAAEDIVESIVLAYGRIFQTGARTDVTLTGSLVSFGGLVFNEITSILAEVLPQAVVVAPRGSALDGAAALTSSKARGLFPDVFHSFKGELNVGP